MASGDRQSNIVQPCFMSLLSKQPEDRLSAFALKSTGFGCIKTVGPSAVSNVMLTTAQQRTQVFKKDFIGKQQELGEWPGKAL